MNYDDPHGRKKQAESEAMPAAAPTAEAPVHNERPVMGGGANQNVMPVQPRLTISVPRSPQEALDLGETAA